MYILIEYILYITLMQEYRHVKRHVKIHLKTAAKL